MICAVQRENAGGTLSKLTPTIAFSSATKTDGLTPAAEGGSRAVRPQRGPAPLQADRAVRRESQR